MSNIQNPGTGGGGGSGTVTSVAGGTGITNSPEPIVGAGTVNLDIDSLTVETALASGDFLAFVDISGGGTAITNQRKITFGNFAANLNTLGTLDHGSLTGLGDDDHLQYFLLAGRSGFQTAIISTDFFGLLAGTAVGTANSGLALAATTNATSQGQLIAINPLTSAYTGDNGVFVFSPFGDVTINDDPGVGQFRLSLLSMGNNFIVGDDSEGGPGVKLLSYSPTITNTPGVTSILSASGAVFTSQPMYLADTDACTVGILNTFEAFQNFSVTNGGTLAVGNAGGIDIRIDTTAGVTVSGAYGVFYEGIKGTGTGVDDSAYVCIDSVATITGNHRSFVSSGPLRELFHAGPALFGVSIGTLTNASCGIELQSVTTAVLLSRMDDTEEGALTAAEGMILYNEDQDRFRGYSDGDWLSFIQESDKVALTAQTATIADTSLANTGTPGVFRISVYVVTTTGDVLAGTISVDIKYTDDSGAQTITVGPVSLATAGLFAQQTIAVETASGSVTYGVTNGGGFGTADYSLYVVAERL